MAFQGRGILDGFKGKLGSIVGYKRLGKSIIQNKSSSNGLIGNLMCGFKYKLNWFGVNSYFDKRLFVQDIVIPNTRPYQQVLLSSSSSSILACFIPKWENSFAFMGIGGVSGQAFGDLFKYWFRVVSDDIICCNYTTKIFIGRKYSEFKFVGFEVDNVGCKFYGYLDCNDRELLYTFNSGAINDFNLMIGMSNFTGSISIVGVKYFD